MESSKKSHTNQKNETIKEATGISTTRAVFGETLDGSAGKTYAYEPAFPQN